MHVERNLAFLPLAAVSLAISLIAGCGKDPDPETGNSRAPGDETPPKTAQVPPSKSELDIPETGIAAIALAKWTGDLGGMIERRLIRVLTTYSKTHYFIDQGTQRGLVPEAFKLFEDDLNKRLKNRHLRVQVVFVPVAHDELVPALLEGRGDIVAAGTLISEWRREAVYFTVVAGGNLRNVALKRKLPVLLAYWTAWVDGEGRTNFRRDLYGQDAKWAAALDAPFRLRTKPLFEPG